MSDIKTFKLVDKEGYLSSYEGNSDYLEKYGLVVSGEAYYLGCIDSNGSLSRYTISLITQSEFEYFEEVDCIPSEVHSTTNTPNIVDKVVTRLKSTPDSFEKRVESELLKLDNLLVQVGGRPNITHELIDMSATELLDMLIRNGVTFTIDEDYRKQNQNGR